MSLFNFGGSSSQSSAFSSSQDASVSNSVSGGSSLAGSQQQIAFEDIFANLFGGASSAAAGLDPSMLTSAANTLFSSGIGFMEGLGADEGSGYMVDRLSGGNDVLQEQIDLLGQDLGRFFENEINPAITSDAIGAGQLGGSRQGVAQGLASDALGRQFAQGATALRAGDIAARDQVAGQLAQNTIGGASVGLGALGALGGLADMGFGANLAPYERLAAILGGPTTLGSSFSTSQDFANAFSQSFGSSVARSSSRGRSFNVGFGEG